MTYKKSEKTVKHNGERKMFKYLKKRKEKALKNKEQKNYQKEFNRKCSAIRQAVVACGSNLKVFGDVDLMSPEKIKIGNDCRLNNRVLLNGRSGIEIGDDVTISHGAMIISAGYDIDNWLSTGKKVHFENKPICVGDHCWIGAGAIVLPGVNITGEYVVVGAGAVVTRDITESRVFVAGNPAKIVKRLGE